MITKEEKEIFEYEVRKLMDEYRQCPDSPLRQKIKEDLQWLKSVIFSSSDRNKPLK